MLTNLTAHLHFKWTSLKIRNSTSESQNRRKKNQNYLFIMTTHTHKECAYACLLQMPSDLLFSSANERYDMIYYGGVWLNVVPQVYLYTQYDDHFQFQAISFNALHMFTNLKCSQPAGVTMLHVTCRPCRNHWIKKNSQWLMHAECYNIRIHNKYHQLGFGKQPYFTHTHAHK